MAVDEASQQLAHYSQFLNTVDERLVAASDEIARIDSDVEQTVAAIEEKRLRLVTARARLLTLPSELEDTDARLQSQDTFAAPTHQKIAKLKSDIQKMITERDKLKSGLLAGPRELSERLKALAQQRKAALLHERIALRANIASAKARLESIQHESAARKGRIHEQRQSQLLGEAQLLQLHAVQKSTARRFEELAQRHEASCKRTKEIEDALPCVLAERSAMDDRFRGLDAENRQLLGRLQQLNSRSPVTQRINGVEWAPREQPAFRSAFALLARSPA